MGPRPNATFADVTDTALWVAAYRAKESLRGDRLFHDPHAVRLAGARGRELATHMVESEAFEWSVVVRTRVIDDLIQAALSRGVDTVMNLGAGFDTRPYRLELPPGLRWIEADDPRVLERKTDLLREATPRCQLERVPVDLADDAARRALFDRVAATSGDTLVLTEGVVAYLTLEATTHLADDLRARANVKQWIVDFTSRFMSAAVRVRTTIRRPFRNAPMRFAVRDWRDFYAQRGWRVADVRYLGVEGARLGRPMALPLWFRPVERVLPAPWRQWIAQTMGYARLMPDR